MIKSIGKSFGHDDKVHRRVISDAMAMNKFCVAAKGEDALECDKFAKYYRALCPGQWMRVSPKFILMIDRWNEKREKGTFPGPL
ncbi:hypothetical protein GQ457_03G029900 [Hibiscus cannabinus]